MFYTSVREVPGSLKKKKWLQLVLTNNQSISAAGNSGDNTFNTRVKTPPISPVWFHIRFVSISPEHLENSATSCCGAGAFYLSVGRGKSSSLCRTCKRVFPAHTLNLQLCNIWVCVRACMRVRACVCVSVSPTCWHWRLGAVWAAHAPA